MNAPKILRISTNEWPDHGRLEAIREIYGRTIIKHDIEPCGDAAFHFKSDLFGGPTFGLASTSVTPCRAVRKSQDIDGDDLVFTVGLEGARIVNHRGREVVLHPGEGLLMSSADTGTTTVPIAARWRSVRIPSAALRPKIDLDACLLRPIPRDNVPLLLLTNYLAAIQFEDILARPELVGPITGHVHDLVSLALGATRDATEIARTRGVRAARLQALKRQVMENLSDGALSVSAVAVRHGITPRYLHMLFESEGTSFTAFLIEQRLVRAYQILTEPQHFRDKISTISRQCGFTDISWFNRTFRRRYGATPSDVREMALKNFR